MMVNFMTAHPHVTLTLLGLAATISYGIACWIWPWAQCGGEWWPWPRRCEAGRVYQDERKKAWRDCRKCGGTAKRRRFGRALWANFIQAKRKADR